MTANPHVTVRVTHAELQQIQARAARAKMSVSEFCHGVLFPTAVAPAKARAASTAETASSEARRTAVAQQAHRDGILAKAFGRKGGKE